ncbi:armadillo-type protein [Staphylotrichum tortipilum]|uniref:Armadillo-type protein n=1 Tax=Staphylotrichum tortipilum TaxID=2831512 RepID=A0AAN6MSQ0_9PEZI|nr:armadillo-type protein [Staphylotrichum longicolle]
MGSTSRRSRLPAYTAATNGADSTSQTTLGTTLFGTGLPSSGPWNSNTAAAFAQNGDVTTRGQFDVRELSLRADERGADAWCCLDAIGSGSTFRSTSSVADTWYNGWHASESTTPARNGAQPRNLPGSTSPRSRPEASPPSMNGLPRYLTTAPQPAATTSLEPSSSSMQYPGPYPGYMDDTNGSSLPVNPFNRFFSYGSSAAKQQAQDLPSLSAVGTATARNSVSSRVDPDYYPQANGFGDLNYVPTAPSRHSQRSSLAGPSFTTSFDQALSRQAQDQVAESLAMMGLDGGSNGAMNGRSNGASYGNGTQGFQFNPVSQPWETQGYANGFAKDSYTNGNGPEKRGSIVGRHSPAGSTYHPTNGLNSPRSFKGTPQLQQAWPRPASRNPRLEADPERQALSQFFSLQPPTAYNHPNTFYPQSYSPFQNPYAAYGDPRHAAGLAGYPLAMPQYGLGPGAIPTRPARDQDPGKDFRSALLDEFMTSKSNKGWELKDIWNHVVEFSGDQKGSRFIQQKLETANSDEKDQVFAELEPNAVQLMKDLFGNYVMQKLFEYGNQVQKKVLAGAMKGKVIDLSMQAYACRVVQKALEHVLVEQQAELARELEADLLRVAKDQHGNHVVQQAIALVPRQHIDFIMDGFKGHVCELASHQYGCRVIQRVLEHGTEADKASILLELHNSAKVLVTDQYGNYVIQHVLEKGSPEDRSRMIGIITPQLLTFSRHKNASNVVEKCILFGTREEQRAIRDQLVAGGDDTNSPLFQLMRDQFGNYVIQKLVKALQVPDRGVLVDRLASHLHSLKRSGATSKQIEAMERLVRESQAPSTSTSNMPTPASTAPTSPGLRVEINSPAAPTPLLTNSPLSTPSSILLNGDAVESGSDHANGQLPGKLASPPTQPRLSEY